MDEWWTDTSKPPCRVKIDNYQTCDFPLGHDGPHRCTSMSEDETKEHYCGLPSGHDGDHACIFGDDSTDCTWTNFDHVIDTPTTMANADIPPHWGDETPPGYAHRLLRLWATDDVEAVDAEAAMQAMVVGDVPTDVADTLSRVRQANGQAHRPMIDCGHCWAARNGLADRYGDWQVVICEECDQPWPCPEASDTPGA